MSRNAKIILGCDWRAGCLLLYSSPGFSPSCCPALALSLPKELFPPMRTWAKWPALLSITTCRPGMQEEMAMNFFGVKTAVFRGSNEQSLIMLMQFPSALAGNEAEMRRQMEDSFGQQFGTDDYRFEVVSREK
jgi:hypothetical protein